MATIPVIPVLAEEAVFSVYVVTLLSVWAAHAESAPALSLQSMLQGCLQGFLFHWSFPGPPLRYRPGHPPGFLFIRASLASPCVHCPAQVCHQHSLCSCLFPALLCSVLPSCVVDSEFSSTSSFCLLLLYFKPIVLHLLSTPQPDEILLWSR